MSRKHRVCRKCGQAWNVSCVVPGGKKYICPWCAWKEKRKSARGMQFQQAHKTKHNYIIPKEDSNVKFITRGH